MAIVLYHANCTDGFGAAWAASKALPESTYIPVKYGEPHPPIPVGEDIFILDFAYPKPVLEKLLKTSKSLQIIDHHKTAKDALEGLPNAIFDLSHSGAVLTWNFFHPTKPCPRLLEYVEDRDLWKWELPDSEQISGWLASYPKTFQIWDGLSKTLATNEGYTEAVREGTAIQRAKRQQITDACDHSRLTSLGGYDNIPVVNTCLYMSEIGNELLEIYPESPFSAYYFAREDGAIQWGLRSRKDFDCSEVAKKLGGGGHPQAAGFTVG